MCVRDSGLLRENDMAVGVLGRTLPGARKVAANHRRCRRPICRSSSSRRKRSSDTNTSGAVGDEVGWGLRQLAGG